MESLSYSEDSTEGINDEHVCVRFGSFVILMPNMVKNIRNEVMVALFEYFSLRFDHVKNCMLRLGQDTAETAYAPLSFVFSVSISSTFEELATMCSELYEPTSTLISINHFPSQFKRWYLTQSGWPDTIELRAKSLRIVFNSLSGLYDMLFIFVCVFDSDIDLNPYVIS